MEDLINENDQRQVSVIVKNEKGEVISEEKIIPELDLILQSEEIYTNIIEELIDQEKQVRKISIYPQNKQIELLEIHSIQEIEEISPKKNKKTIYEEKIKKFEELLKKYPLTQ